MATLNVSLLAITLVLVGLGACGIGWVRGQSDPRRIKLGRWLFTVSLLVLGLIAIVAALVHADALAPLGLLSGFLVVAMLWETPEPSWQRGP